MQTLELKQFSYSYSDQKGVLFDISLQIPWNSLVGILGPSGAGKTTLLSALFEQARQQGSAAVYAPQKLQLIPYYSVLENVLLGRLKNENPLHLLKIFSALDQSDSLDLLKKLEMEDYSDKMAQYISGGQAQRAGIARSLVKSAEYYFLDEPTSSLDPELSRKVFSLLKEKSRKDSTVVVNIHQSQLALDHCDHIITLKDGRVFKAAAKNDFAPKDFQDLYEKEGPR